MHVAVIALPSELPEEGLCGRCVVVLDVIRATTTMAFALASGAPEVRVFPSLGAAQTSCREFVGPKVLVGERQCLRPPGFDLGNSPDEMTRGTVGGRIVFMSTTNGTRTIRAAFDHPTLMAGEAAPDCFTGALVNATATARRLIATGRDVLLLCAGSDGEVAEEDLIGAGAVMQGLADAGAQVVCTDDCGARDEYARFRRDGVLALKRTLGGRKLLAAGLGRDLAACAAVDSVPIVCRVDRNQRVRADSGLS